MPNAAKIEVIIITSSGLFYIPEVTMTTLAWVRNVRQVPTVGISEEKSLQARPVIPLFVY